MLCTLEFYKLSEIWFYLVSNETQQQAQVMTTDDKLSKPL